MSELIERVSREILSRKLLQPGRKILVAVSGGVDSMVLLHLLARLAAKQRWRLAAAHFNHRLRGKHSDADERFVRRRASRLGIPFFSGNADVKALATKEKLSIEMAARRLRHEFLARAARQWRARTIALAHHGGDQAELLFLRLFRGSGGEGLSGLRRAAPSPEDARITLVRPLLGLSKHELLHFAREEGVPFREDASNADLAHERNRVRHRLLPLITRDFAPGAEAAMLRSIEIVGAEADLAGTLARAWLGAANPEPFDHLHLAVQRRALLLQLFPLGVTADFDLVERLRLHPAQRTMPAPDLELWRDEKGIVHAQPARPRPEFDTAEKVLSFAGDRGSAQFGSCTVSWRRVFRTGKAIPSGTGERVECFDADKLGATVHLRHWQAGDRFQPIGMPRPLKLHDWFINRKVPRHLRHRLLVAASANGELFWVEGQRIAELAKVTEATRHLIEWRWQRTD